MFNNGVLLKGNTVAPFAGAWIEIVVYCRNARKPVVAPFAGAWIEMVPITPGSHTLLSLPSRERGLKCVQQTRRILFLCVAPFAGAWIEI